MLHIPAGLQKNNSKTLWPIAPEWGDMLLAVPAAERHGPVFPVQAAIAPDSVSRIVCKIGEKAGIIVNRTTKKRHKPLISKGLYLVPLGESNRARILREIGGSPLSATRIPTHFAAIPS
jgi:hypothetical protein